MANESGYCACLCRDCFDIAMTDEHGNDSLCADCEDAGCEPFDGECQRDDAYGVGDEDDTERA